MSESIDPAPPTPAIVDPWSATGTVPLDGYLERHRFWPGFLAVAVLIAGLILFNVIGGVATIVFLAIAGADLSSMAQDLPALIEEHAGIILSGNAVGQGIGLALLALLLARLHSSRPQSFVRLRAPSLPLLVCAVLGLFALIPVVQWLGAVNQSLPLPDVIREFEESQMELIEKVLLGDLSLAFSLAVLALTPAICEELFFRGYVQRQLERSILGVGGGILVTGLFFGLFHFRLTQILPLSLLGFYLAYLAWRTGSIWIPIAIHFLNNGLAVVAAAYIRTRPDLDMADLDQMEVPWYAVVMGLLCFALLIFAMHKWAAAELSRRPTHAHSPNSSALQQEPL